MKTNTTHKKISFVLAAMLLTGALGTTSMAFAKGNKGGGFTGPSDSGGYTGPGPAIMTLKEGASQADDTWVTFRGKIVNHKGDDKYTFQDASGMGVVEIDRKAWRGAKVGPQDEVELLVEVDKDWGSVEFDVKSVKLLTK